MTLAALYMGCKFAFNAQKEFEVKSYTNRSFFTLLKQLIFNLEKLFQLSHNSLKRCLQLPTPS